VKIVERPDIVEESSVSTGAIAATRKRNFAGVAHVASRSARNVLRKTSGVFLTARPGSVLTVSVSA